MQHEYATPSVNARPPATARRSPSRFPTWLLLSLLAGSAAVFGQTPTLSPARNAMNVARTANVSVSGVPLTVDALNAIRVFSPQYGQRVFGERSLTGGNTLSFNPTFDFKPGETLFTTLKGGGGLQKQVYQFTVAAGQGPGTFSGGSNPVMGDQSRTVVAADVDGDWDVDILTANVSNSRVDVALNDGAGNFSPAGSVPVQAAPLCIAVADVDEDGDLDLLAANANSNSVSVRLNNGVGTFSGTQNVPVGRSPYGVAAADVDADGDLDLLTANFTGNSVSVRLNNGAGTFSGTYDVGFGDGHGPHALAAGDVNNDGDLDMVVARAASNSVAVLSNDGNGTFSVVSLSVGAFPGSITAADVDGDRDLDVLTANANSNTVSVRTNNGAGSFSNAADVPAGSGVRNLTAADVDGDGDLDLLATNHGASSTVVVRLNNGAGSFGSAPAVPVGNSPYGITTGDVDGDGDLDLLTSNYGAGSVSVRLNQPPPPVLSNGNINKPGQEDVPVTFTAADFTNAFTPTGTLVKVRFTSLPLSGTLKLGAANVAVNQEIPVADLGTLVYVPAANYHGPVSFFWNGGNDGAYAQAAAPVNLTLAPVNDAPTVGNISKPLGTEDLSVVFAAAEFGAAFSDVDGNNLATVRILSLPANGQLKLSGSALTPNQEIAYASLGGLVYTPNANYNGSDSFGWNGSDGTIYAAGPAQVYITVRAVNDAPVLAGVPAAAQIDELVPFTFQATATDADGAANTLAFSLVGAPAGATINPETGAFSWTPTEAQGAGSYTFTVKVSDGSLEDSQSVTLTVKEVNTAPVLAPIGNREVNEGVTVTFQVSATDADAGTGAYNRIMYELARAPSGAHISPAGVFSWTPLEEDGPGTYTFKVQVRDNGIQTLYDEEEITITVKELNVPPHLIISVTQFTINEGALLTFQPSANDQDLPALPMTFSVAGAPEGASIDPATGVFSWRPTEAQGPQTYTFRVKVSDGTAEDSEQIAVTVNEVNALPVLTVPARITGKELTELTFTAVAADTDLPANPLYFSLTGAPAGARIDPLTGVFSWTPTEEEGGTGFDYRIGVGVADAENASPVVFETVRIFVEEVNQAPVLLGFPMTLTADELATLQFTASAEDPDRPAGPLTFSLVGAPAGAAIGSSGGFSWTPGETQGANTYTFHVRVSDGSLSADGQVTVTVNETNAKPVLAPVEALQGNEHAPITFQATATDPDVPANALTYSLLGAPAGAAIDPATGAFSWTPTEEQDGFFSFLLTVRDNGTPSLSDTWFVIATVNEANAAPVLAPVGPRTVDERSPLTFTASATDADRVDGVADVLTFSLLEAPVGASIDPATGAFSWTPTEAQDGSFTFTIRVTDGTLSDQEQITVTVKEINTAPVLTLAAAPASVNELVAFSLQASATDADVPANPLTFSLASAPAGATINAASGLVSWTPTEAQGNNTSYTFTVRVSDGALTDEQTFSVLVQEVNAAPVLARTGSREADEQAALTFQAAASDVDLPANALTYTLVGAPAGAAITAGGAFSWTPTEAQGPGAFTFRVKVTDNGTPALSDEEEITVTVKEVNAAPVLAGVPATRETPWGNAIAFQATATDADVPSNALTFSLVGAPAGAVINPGTGAFSWTPAAGQTGSHPFKVKVTDDGTPNLSDERQITVTVSKRATALVYNGEVTRQYSDQVGLSAVLTDIAGGLPGTPLPGKTITFALGTQSAGATTGAGGVAATTLKLDQPAATVPVVPGFAGDALYLPSTDNDPFVVTREDAEVVYAGLEYFATANASADLASVEYMATLTDKADGSRGVITQALAAFSGNPGRTVNVSLVNPADPTVGGARTGVFTEKLTASEYSSGGKTYPVEVSAVGHFYTGRTRETTLITVAVPGTDYVNGGGNLVLTQSGGTYAATAGSKMNFGFTMKWNKSGKNIQGQANIIFRRLVDGVWRTYQIKSNAINTLGTFNVAGGRRADFNTKANVTDVTNPLSPVSLGGGLDLSVQAFESTDRAFKNQISVTVRNGNVLVFSSCWNGSASLMQPLNGGAIRVRSNTAVAAVAGRQDAAAGTAEAAASFAVSAYPSPFADAFTLRISGGVTGDVAITVVDGKGRTVTRQVAQATGQGSRNVAIDLSGEPHGVYLLHVQSGAGREVIKVFKVNR